MQVVLRKLSGADPEGRRHCIKLLRTFDYRGHLCLVFEAMVSTLALLACTWFLWSPSPGWHLLPAITVLLWSLLCTLIAASITAVTFALLLRPSPVPFLPCLLLFLFHTVIMLCVPWLPWLCEIFLSRMFSRDDRCCPQPVSSSWYCSHCLNHANA